MTEILINGESAIPSEGVNIKLTRENPYFTNVGSYTYDVEFPLGNKRNYTIFGGLDRADTIKADGKYHAEIINNGVTILSGEAHITECSNELVKLQFLGESSAYNCENKKKYIDELPLYSFYEGAHATIEGLKTDTGESIYDGELGWVAFPTINQEAEETLNKVYWERIYDGEGEWTESRWSTIEALQPMMWFVTKKIAEATGYHIDDEDNIFKNDALLKKIFLVNPTYNKNLRDMLPHWTVTEFWDYIEETFAVMCRVDSAKKKITLIGKSDVYRSENTAREFINPINDFEVEIEDSTEAEGGTAKVSFEGDNLGAEDFIKKEIEKYAIIEERFANANELLDWGRTQGEVALKLHFKGTIFRCADNRDYIFVEDALGYGAGFVEVNMFSPRCEGSEEEEEEEEAGIKLKIVPAKYEDYEAEIIATRSHGATNREVIGTLEYAAISVPGCQLDKATEQGEIDLEMVINGDTEDGDIVEKNKFDKMFIAMTNRDTLDWLPGWRINVKNPLYSTPRDRIYRHPRARLRQRLIAPLVNEYSSEDIVTIDGDYSLSLKRVTGLKNLASRTFADGYINYDPRITYRFRFVSDKVPDIGATYVIRGKQFACVKLECNLLREGAENLYEGYFYAIE